MQIIIIIKSLFQSPLGGQVKGFSTLRGGKLKTLAYKVVIHLRVAYIPLKSIFTDTAW